MHALLGVMMSFWLEKDQARPESVQRTTYTLFPLPLFRAVCGRSWVRAVLPAGAERVVSRRRRVRGAGSAAAGKEGPRMRLLHRHAASHRSPRLGFLLLPRTRPTGPSENVVSSNSGPLHVECLRDARIDNKRFDRAQKSRNNVPLVQRSKCSLMRHYL